jgi:cytochrome c peroxidase
MNKTKNCEKCHLVKIFEELEREKNKLFKLNQIRESKEPIFLKKREFDYRLLGAN